MDDLDFKNKRKIARDKEIAESVSLCHSTLIKNPETEAWLDLQKNYADITEQSDAFQRAACSITNSILTHNRLYFCMSRDGIIKLMLADLNFPPELRKAFSTRAWDKLLAILYNDFSLIKLKQRGLKKNSSVYEVTQPKLVNHLKSKQIDAKIQLAEAITFATKRR